MRKPIVRGSEWRAGRGRIPCYITRQAGTEVAAGHYSWAQAEAVDPAGPGRAICSRWECPAEQQTFISLGGALPTVGPLR